MTGRSSYFFVSIQTFELLDRLFDISHYAEFTKLAQELIELRKQLKATSAMVTKNNILHGSFDNYGNQDEFAKWAKLNRACTKKENQFEALRNSN